ncbi:hypothetical protein FXO38_28043 [Capsicum annuum]|nr:hypothetical protein FXO38_28043 [Capsicum annuum]KAF3630896.1 hypothetical protein FXO37_28271 [Capsicum annuum]
MVHPAISLEYETHVGGESSASFHKESEKKNTLKDNICGDEPYFDSNEEASFELDSDIDANIEDEDAAASTLNVVGVAERGRETVGVAGRDKGYVGVAGRSRGTIGAAGRGRGTVGVAGRGRGLLVLLEGVEGLLVLLEGVEELLLLLYLMLVVLLVGVVSGMTLNSSIVTGNLGHHRPRSGVKWKEKKVVTQQGLQKIRAQKRMKPSSKTVEMNMSQTCSPAV